MGAKIANASWGCAGEGCFSFTLRDAVDVARGRGMLIVAAAGNDGTDNDVRPFYPCGFDASNIICVAATDQRDQRSAFNAYYSSNYGRVSVDLGAPGSAILSTVPTGSCTLCDSSGYRYLSGTSMAAPHAAGAAALLMAQFPSLSADQIIGVLLGSVDPRPALSQATLTGGRLNVNRGVQSRFVMTAPPSLQRVPAGEAAVYTVTVSSLNHASGVLSLSLSTSEPLLTGSFSPATVTIAADGSATSTLTVTAAPGILAGRHALQIHSTDGVETRTVPVQLEVQTNLAVTAVTGPSTGAGGAWISVSDTVRNLGAGRAGGFYVGWYLSDDWWWSSDDRRVGSRWVTGLSPGADSSASTMVWIPSATSPRQYSLIAVVDDTDMVPETDEGNILTGPLMSIIPGVNRDPAWAATYDGPAGGSDYGERIVSDRVGNSYVSGRSCAVLPPPETAGCLGYDFATVAYDPSGRQRWAARYDGGNDDQPQALAVDGNGNVYVSGYSNGGTYDYLTMKYDSAGTLLWTARYDSGGSDGAFALAVDTGGNVYVTGSSQRGTWDYVTVKYDSGGRQLWAVREDSGEDYAVALALDGSGSVWVTGQSQTGATPDYLTVKYDSAGTRRWSARYDRGFDERPAALAADGFGNIIVTGFSVNGRNFDYATLKYSAAGSLLWTAGYDNGDHNVAIALAVDGAGRSYVTGYSFNGRTGEFATLKYEADGRRAWVVRYGEGSGDFPAAIVLDSAGTVYVSGTGDTYALHPSVVTLKIAPDGQPSRFSKYQNALLCIGTGLSIDPSGNIYVAGYRMVDVGRDEADVGFLTAKYEVGAGSGIDLVENAVSEPPGSARPGTSFSVSDTVANKGGSGAG
ncbi:MAG: S8 family serine peptidase, partial [Nitrospiria bacterium]